MVLTAALAAVCPADLCHAGRCRAWLVSLVARWLILRGRGKAAQRLPVDGIALRNPFALGPALLLMGLTMALTLLARWVLERYGDAGLATVLAISGTVDVDSAIITMGNLPPGTLDPADGRAGAGSAGAAQHAVQDRQRC